MISKERLDEVSHLYSVGGSFSLSSPELAELIKLARLGLWAREHGHTIQAAFSCISRENPEDCKMITDALESMPKEGE